jgi:preprotein translocase subunit Sec61beta
MASSGYKRMKNAQGMEKYLKKLDPRSVVREGKQINVKDAKELMKRLDPRSVVREGEMRNMKKLKKLDPRSVVREGKQINVKDAKELPMNHMVKPKKLEREGINKSL